MLRGVVFVDNKIGLVVACKEQLLSLKEHCFKSPNSRVLLSELKDQAAFDQVPYLQSTVRVRGDHLQIVGEIFNL